MSNHFVHQIKSCNHIDSRGQEETKAGNSEHKKKIIARSIVVLSAVFIVVLISLCGFNYIKSIPGKEYKRGLEAYNEHRYEDAVGCFQKAAERGNALAQFFLGKCYYNGDGIKRDSDEAIKWFRKAADQDNADAQYRLGLCYQNGIGVNCRVEEALFWFKKASEQGHQESRIHIGDLYYMEGTYQDYSEALRWYQEAGKIEREARKKEMTICKTFLEANAGNATSQLAVFAFYEGGIQGFKQDKKEAIKWLRKAADSGSAKAQNMLGFLYFVGDGDHGVEKNFTEAKKWCQKAADQKDDKAQKMLGDLYFIKEEFQESVKWYRKAAEQGNTDAMERLSDIYSNGYGVK